MRTLVPESCAHDCSDLAAHAPADKYPYTATYAGAEAIAQADEAAQAARSGNDQQHEQHIFLREPILDQQQQLIRDEYLRLIEQEWRKRNGW
jgi:hypothetical protein